MTEGKKRIRIVNAAKRTIKDLQDSMRRNSKWVDELEYLTELLPKIEIMKAECSKKMSVLADDKDYSSERKEVERITYQGER